MIRTLDGAMGTELMKRGLRPGEPSALWNVTRPDDVLAVHRSYAASGSDAITSNTFGANRYQLAIHGLEGRLEEINRAAVVLARAAADGRIVLGDVGPTGAALEPYGDLEIEDLISAVRRQGQALAEAGIDAFLVETFGDPMELELTVRTLVDFGAPVYATFAFERKGDAIRTPWGIDPAEGARRAVAAGAEAVGSNCGAGLSLDDYLVIGRAMRGAVAVPVILQPNAGSPEATAGGFSYASDVEAFRAWATEARSLGDVVLGGCCGTTPAHIAAIAETP